MLTARPPRLTTVKTMPFVTQQFFILGTQIPIAFLLSEKYHSIGQPGEDGGCIKSVIITSIYNQICTILLHTQRDFLYLKICSTGRAKHYWSGRMIKQQWHCHVLHNALKRDMCFFIFLAGTGTASRRISDILCRSKIESIRGSKTRKRCRFWLIITAFGLGTHFMSQVCPQVHYVHS